MNSMLVVVKTRGHRYPRFPPRISFLVKRHYLADIVLVARQSDQQSSSICCVKKYVAGSGWHKGLLVKFHHAGPWCGAAVWQQPW